MGTFTHLHVHSRYTLLGATPSVEALAARAAAEGMTHLALTDTLALYGAAAFSRACQRMGVQPILGMTVPLAWPADLPPIPGSETPGLLVLLATGPEGYRSLCRLSSLAQGRADREAFCQRGLSLASLQAHTAGVIALSGGRRGWIERGSRAAGGAVRGALPSEPGAAHGGGRSRRPAGDATGGAPGRAYRRRAAGVQPGAGG